MPNHYPTSTAPTGSQLIKQLEILYRTIKRRHPELPDVIFITGKGFTKSKMKLGHFQREAWQQAKEEHKLPEIQISGETIGLGAEQVLQTVLHEAAHALCFARDCKDCSGQGNRYHNDVFRCAAAELGLAWPEGQEADKQRGYSAVELTEATKERYAKDLERLRKALEVFLAPPVAVGTKGPKEKDRNNIKAVCGCGRIIRMSRSVYESSAIDCMECVSPFLEEA